MHYICRNNRIYKINKVTFTRHYAIPVIRAAWGVNSPRGSASILGKEKQMINLDLGNCTHGLNDGNRRALK